MNDIEKYMSDMYNIEFGFVSKEPVSYDEAVMYCFFYNQPGSTGWRLPTCGECVEFIWEYGVWSLGDDEVETFVNDLYHVIPVRDL